MDFLLSSEYSYFLEADLQTQRPLPLGDLGIMSALKLSKEKGVQVTNQLIMCSHDLWQTGKSMSHLEGNQVQGSQTPWTRQTRCASDGLSHYVFLAAQQKEALPSLQVPALPKNEKIFLKIWGHILIHFALFVLASVLLSRQLDVHSCPYRWPPCL